MTTQSGPTQSKFLKLLFQAAPFIIFALVFINNRATPKHPLEAAFLSLGDVPGGWRVTEQKFHDTGGQVGYHRRDAHVNVGRTITQRITVFNSNEGAVNEYINYKERFSDEVELSVYRIDLNNNHSFIICYPVQMSPLVEGCAVYLVHNNVFMIVTAGIYENDGFTFQDFRNLLSRADEKLKLAFP